MADSIQVGVKVVLDQSGLKAQLNGLLSNVRQQIENLLKGKTFYLKGLTIGIGNDVKLTNNVAAKIQAALRKQLKASPIKLSSVTIDKNSLNTRAQQIGQQFATQIVRQINQGLYKGKTQVKLTGVQIKSDSLDKQAAALAKQFSKTFQAQLNAANIRYNPKVTAGTPTINRNSTGGTGGTGSNTNTQVQQVNNLANALRRVTDLYRSTDQIINRMMTTDPTSGAFTKMNADLQRSEQQLTRLSGVIDQARARYAHLFDGTTGNPTLVSMANKYDNAASKYTQDLNNLRTYTNNVRQQMKELEQIYAQFQSARERFTDAKTAPVNSTQQQQMLAQAKQARDQAESALRMYKQTYGNNMTGNAQGAALQNILRLIQQINTARQRGVVIENQISKATEKVKLDYTNLITKMQQFQSRMAGTLQNSSVNGQLQALISRSQEQLNANTFSVAGLAGIKQEFANIQASAAGATASMTTFGGSLANLAMKAAQWFGVTQLIWQSINMIRDMVTNVSELDKSMTEVRKVTDESELAYSTFLQDAGTKATELGSTVKDVVDATGDFARLGYSLKEAFDLSQSATTLQTVGDDINSIQDASDALISTMAAFKIEASDSMTIVDKLNMVGNNFSISTGGLSEALKRSAAAMAVAGNSIEETLGLVTAGNEITRDSDVVGTALKTISLRINCMSLVA